MNCRFDSRRQFLRRSGALCAAAPLAGVPRAWGQAVTTKILCGTPAGSIPDYVARRYAEALTTRRPGSAFVENRPGAAGQIAITALKQATPDGGTIMLAPGAVSSIYPFLYGKLSYDPDADLQPLSSAAEATLALAVGPAVPDSVRTLEHFIAWSRANPALANFGSPGQGTLPHLLSALFFHEAKVAAQHAGYAGGPPAVVDLLGGRIAALSLPEGLLRPHHESRKLRILATSGPVRSTFLPDVPTFVEQGFPNLVIREWFAFFAGGSVPASIASSTSQTIRAAAEGSPLAAAFREMGMVVVTSTPEATKERIVSERQYWKAALTMTGIRAEL